MNAPSFGLGRRVKIKGTNDLLIVEEHLYLPPPNSQIFTGKVICGGKDEHGNIEKHTVRETELEDYEE